MEEINVAIIDPFPERRAWLGKMILKNAGGQSGLLRIHHYSNAYDCPRKMISRCGAIFMSINSGEDVMAAYRLRPEPEIRWPFVVVTDHGRFSLDGHTLWARYCLIWPPPSEQVAEAVRRCLKPETLRLRETGGKA